MGLFERISNPIIIFFIIVLVFLIYLAYKKKPDKKILLGIIVSAISYNIPFSNLGFGLLPPYMYYFNSFDLLTNGLVWAYPASLYNLHLFRVAQWGFYCGIIAGTFNEEGLGSVLSGIAGILLGLLIIILIVFMDDLIFVYLFTTIDGYFYISSIIFGGFGGLVGNYLMNSSSKN